jgi:peptidoglycan/LPS O-acetylase OafA/YrhL
MASGRISTAFLDGYRGLGCLTVVVFHAYQNNRDPVTWKWPLEGTVWHYALYSTDFWVDMFFVLSGFLLMLPYAKTVLDGGSPRSARGFLVRRAARIVPLYLIVVLIVWAASNPVLPGDWRDLLLHLTFTHVFSQDKVFFTDGPAWSLAVEVQMYLMLALLGALAQRIARRIPDRGGRLAMLLGMIGVLVAIALTYKYLAVYVWEFPETYWPAWFGPLSKVDVFAVGMLVGILHVAGVRLPDRWLRWTVGLSGFGLIIGISWARWPVWPHGLHETFAHSWYAIGCAMMIGSSLLGGTPGPKWANSRVLLSVGAASYSLYLWHEPVLRVLRGAQLLPPVGGLRNAIITAVILLAVSIPVAYLSFRTLERISQLVVLPVDSKGRKKTYYDELPDPDQDGLRAVDSTTTVRPLPSGGP